MSQTAAEKIIIEDAVLRSQERTLGDAGKNIEKAAEPAGREMSASGFGVMCAFLVGPMNAMAGRISATASQTAALAERMQEGVTEGREAFTQFEDDTVAMFERTEVGP